MRRKIKVVLNIIFGKGGGVKLVQRTTCANKQIVFKVVLIKKEFLLI
jgi:hypothetical protein